MVFETNTQSKNKNLFVAGLYSRKTGKLASWINPPESFTNEIFGKKPQEVTPAEMRTLYKLYSNETVELIVKDPSLKIATINPKDF